MRAGWSGLGVVLALGVAGCGGSPPAPTCVTDLDCREAARCIAGRCALELADVYTAPDAAPENATLIITIVEPDSGVDEDAREP